MTDNDVPLRTIRLYGKLGARFGRVFRLAVQSPAEAVRALCCMIPGFEREFMTAHDRGVGFAVFIDKRSIGEDQLLSGLPGDIRIAPVLTGRKNGGWMQVIVGVIIIAAATYFSLGTATAPTTAAVFGTGITGVAISLGVAMVLGGVTQLLTPTPKGLGTKDGPDNGASYRFNGPVNTTAQGNPVPLLYGELIIGSAVVSAAIMAEDQQ